MAEQVPPAIHKAGVLLIGLGATAAGLTPSDSRLCDGHWVTGISLACSVLLAGGPLYGTGASLGTSRWRPLWIGIGVGFAGLVLSVWFLSLL